MSRQRYDRSVTLMVPEQLFERIEAVAFAGLQADVGNDAKVADVNMSGFLRDRIGKRIEVMESSAEGGADALAERYRQAKIASIQFQLAEIQQEHL